MTYDRSWTKSSKGVKMSDKCANNARNINRTHSPKTIPISRIRTNQMIIFSYQLANQV